MVFDLDTEENKEKLYQHSGWEIAHNATGIARKGIDTTKE